MPFTPAHAVVALLPFRRVGMLPAAVAVGAMAPDLPLFLPNTPLTYQLTHTSIAVSALVALGLLAMWYGMLRPAVREGTPEWFARRIPPDWDAVPAVPRSLTRRLGVVAGLIAGVVSHLVWDAFTHQGRWGVRLVPVLADSWGPLPGYVWLQRGTGVAGVMVLLCVGTVWWMHRAVGARVSRVLPGAARWVCWLALPVLLVAAWLVGLVVWGPLTPEFTLRHLAYRTLPSATGAWGVLALLFCVALSTRRAALRARNRM